MNYSEIVAAALAYSDRNYSDEVQANMNNFIKIVESKINRKLRAEGLTKRSHMVLFSKEYYCLPTDFNGIIDIVYKDTVDSINRTQVHYAEQEAINAFANITLPDGLIYYNIIANQLHIMPILDSGVIELIHHIKVPALTASNTTNNISDDYPDCYIKGILAEIYEFVKDYDAAKGYAELFNIIVDELIYNDYKQVFAGSRLQIMYEE